MNPQSHHPAVPLIQTAAEYEAMLARFWELVDCPHDLPLLLAMREAMRPYEYTHDSDTLTATTE